MACVRAMVGGTLCLLLLVSIGCNEGGAKLAKASGVVKFKGEPLEGATITAVFGKEVATGVSDKDGKFTLTTGGRSGAPIGTGKVSVSKTKESTYASDLGLGAAPTPQDFMKGAQSKNMANTMKAPTTTDRGTTLPEKYLSPDSSGLTIVIPEGGVEDLELNLVE